MDLPKRKRLRLYDYDYSQNGAYFITVCALEKHMLFGKIVGRDALGAPSLLLSEYGKIVSREIEETPQHYAGLSLDTFIVMPNHVYLLLAVNRDSEPQISSAENGAPRASRPTTALIPVIIAAPKRKLIKIAAQIFGKPHIMTTLYAMKPNTGRSGDTSARILKNGRKTDITVHNE